MSYRLSGINPLAYVGVEPSTPPQMLVLPRSPLPTDSVGYNLGTYWLVAAPPPTRNWELWILVDLTAGVATWIQLYPGGSGGANQFDEDVGIAVPALGIINVLGGANMNTFGSGNTILINLNETIHWPSTTNDGLVGAIYLGGSNGSGGFLFMHNYGVHNTWLGENAGNLTLTSGTANYNTGIGYLSLNSLTTGAFNTAIAAQGLSSLTSGSSNFSGGDGSLQHLIDGSDNTCIGADSGINYNGSESNNILINNNGVIGENQTTRIGSTQTAAYMAGIYGNSVGVTNQTVIVDNTGKLGSIPTVSPGGIIITTFLTSGTWTKNVNTKVVNFYVWNGGHGGGSGRQGASGAASGGGGGSPGNFYTYTLLAQFCGATESITIGMGGSGGSAQAGVNTNGNAGSLGGASGVAGVIGWFGNTSIFTSFSTNFNPTGKGGGTVSGFGGCPNIVGDMTSTPVSGYFNSSSAGQGSATNGSNGGNIGSYQGIGSVGINAYTQLFTGYFSGGQGGGGGGANSGGGGTGGSGSNIVAPTLTTILYAGATGGIADTNGTNGVAQPTSGALMVGGGGGSGGGGMTAIMGGIGGNGTVPGGGGGGGGGSLNGTPSGAGGTGANGMVIVVEYL